MQSNDVTNPYVTNENELEKIFEIFLSESEHTRRLSKQTIKGYKEVFRTFQKIVPEVTTIDSLNTHMIREFFRRLGTRKRRMGDKVYVGVKPSTTSTYYGKLMVFFKWLEKNEYIKEHSISQKIAKPPRPTYDDDRALTTEEVAQMISAITTYATKDDYMFRRDLAILSLLLYTGIRKGELLGLRVQDLDFEKKTIFINRDTSKSKKDRLIPMHSKLESHLINYLNERKKRNFTTGNLITTILYDKGLTGHGLKHWVEKYKKLSGVPFHLHRCRHTFACTLAKTGSDITSIMRLLGHSTMRMTERYLRSIKTEDTRMHIDNLRY